MAELPDLSGALREASPEDKRPFFDPFDLRVVYDKAGGSVGPSARITQAWPICVAREEIAGAGFEPATFGL